MSDVSARSCFHLPALLFGTGAAVLFAFAIEAEPAHSQTSPAGEVPWASSGEVLREWWTPGQGTPLEPFKEYTNALGRVGIVNADGPFETVGHPFFEPIGENGRACVSCHQPSDGMSLSLDSIRQRWEVTGGMDPIFAPIDGMNCPDLPAGDPASSSLLLDRGTFRVFVPWPPKAANGSPMEPEFDIEIVRDPTGCNTHPEYGLTSANPMISVYRRPRVMANMRYITSGGGLFNIKDGSLMSLDPATGGTVSMQLMADGREPTLATQAATAAATHLELNGSLSAAQLSQIRAFQDQVYSAQSFNAVIGDINDGGATALGPTQVQHGEFGLGDNFTTPNFGTYEGWDEAMAEEGADKRAFRESVIRGYEVFFVRPFWIRDITHLNTVGLGNPIKRTCATCHNALMMGNDIAPGWMDLGTTNMPWTQVANNPEVDRNPYAHAFDQATTSASPDDLNRVNDLPLFKLTCKPSALPHPFLGRVIYTTDPGRALISGRCLDIGAITMQQFRGLAARAPYFSNGSSRNLRELVDYYDLRFDARYSELEKQDLVNFLSVL